MPEVAGIAADTVLRLAPGVRLRDDPVRGRTLLLAPERAVALDEIAAAIVGALDGERALGEIAHGFAARYDAPEAQILADVLDFADACVARGWLEVAS